MTRFVVSHNPDVASALGAALDARVLEPPDDGLDRFAAAGQVVAANLGAGDLLVVVSTGAPDPGPPELRIDEVWPALADPLHFHAAWSVGTARAVVRDGNARTVLNIHLAAERRSITSGTIESTVDQITRMLARDSELGELSCFAVAATTSTDPETLHGVLNTLLRSIEHGAAALSGRTVVVEDGTVRLLTQPLIGASASTLRPPWTYERLTKAFAGLVGGSPDAPASR